jgi:hypothetical protein
MAVPIEEGRESRADAFDQRYGLPTSAHTVT